MPPEKIPSHVQAARKRGDIEALIAMGRKGNEVKKKKKAEKEEIAEAVKEFLDEQQKLDAQSVIDQRHGDPEN